MSAHLLRLWVPAVVGLLLVGSAPGCVLRLLVRIYPKNHPRRQELVAELYTVPYRERLLFVAQHLELALTEGMPARWRLRRTAVSLEPKDLLVGEDLGYRGPTVCKIIGITYRQLDYWARTELIRPSIADAKDSGSQRRYSYRDLVDLMVIKSLLDAGVSLQSARVAIEYLRRNLGDNVRSTRLVLNGIGSALVRSDGELVDLMRRGEGVFSIVALDGVKEELDAAITVLRPPRAKAS